MQTHELPEWAEKRLDKALRKTLAWLALATTPQQVGEDKVRVPAMPKTAIGRTKLQGLCFIHRRKWAAGMSYSKEIGFVIGRQVKPDGSAVWSGPVFVKSTSYGLGLAAGYLRSGTCLALTNETALHSVSHRKTTFGVSACFLVDMNGSRVRPTLFDSSGSETSNIITDAHGGMMATYYMGEAMLAEASLRGGVFGLDTKMNTALYGPGVDMDDVLACKVRPPPQMTPLYLLLNDYEGETNAGALDRSVRGARGLRPLGKARSFSACSSTSASMHDGLEAGGASPTATDDGAQRGGSGTAPRLA